MELLLIKEGLWDIVKNAIPAVPDDQWLQKDGKARAAIGLRVEDNQLSHIRKQTTAKGAWQALQDHHQKATLSNQVSLLRRLCSIRLEEGGDMEKHIQSIDDTLDQLAALGEVMAEKMAVAFMLSSLPVSYATLITALETRPDADLTTSLVRIKMLDEYKRRTNHALGELSSEEKALKSLSLNPKEKEKPFNSFKGSYHDADKGSKGSCCFFCKKPGHFKQDCRKYKDWKKKHTYKETTNKAKRVNHNGEDSEQPICFKVNNKCDREKWYVDSGATVHISCRRDFFTSIDSSVKKAVQVADGKEVVAEGVGEGTLRCRLGKGKAHDITVKGVLFVPNFNGSLLSVKRLTSLGLTVNFEGEKCLITKNGKTVAMATVKGGLFELDEEERVLSVTNSQDLKCIHVWHRRFGHRDATAVQEILNRELANDIRINTCNTQEICECCIKSKMTRKPFPSSSNNRSKGVLDLIHTDVCGPIQTQTPGGKRYILTVIDDYSRYTTLYLLREKSEIPDKLRQFITAMKIQFGKVPKIIRSDRGGEYTSTVFQEYLKNEGIRVQLTAPYTPQQNGIAERKNRSLIEMTRCLLTDSKLNNRFWGEAAMTANYLQNRLPTKACDTMPYQLWYGAKPSLEHLRIFGSPAYVMIPEQKRRKLDNKATKLVLVGYSEVSKAYRLLNPKDNSITISRDVRFIEDHSHQEMLPVEKEVFGEKKVAIENTDVDVISSGEEDEPNNDKDDDKEQTHVQPEIRRSQRTNKGVSQPRLIEVINQVQNAVEEPKNYEAAMSSDNGHHWKKAMDIEMRSLKENKTWTLTEAPCGKNIVGSKWVFKVKRDENGIIDRFKARLVAQGYSQKFGVDYDEVFAPVAKQVTLRILLTIAAQENLIVKHYDIETAFINGDLSHVVFMKPAEGYESEAQGKVYKLNKNLYGLKQGALEWSKKFDNAMIQSGFMSSEEDKCLYIKKNADGCLYSLVHVDDVIAAAFSDLSLEQFEADLGVHFKIKNLGNLKHYLGIQFDRKGNEFHVHQKLYIEKKLAEFKLSDSKPSNIPIDPGYGKRNEVHQEMKDKENYRRAIGSLLYLSTNTRPDIAIATSILARKVSLPTEADWTEVKRIFKYLKKTIKVKLRLGGSHVETGLTVFVDADWGGDAEDRKSNTGYLLKLNGSTIHWSSKKQQLVALSSTEAEYIALSEAAKDTLWIKRLAESFGIKIQNPIKFFEDNQSCIKLLCDAKASHRTKHVDTKYHFVRELQANGTIEVDYLCSAEMTADLLTKPLEAVKLRKFVADIGLFEID